MKFQFRSKSDSKGQQKASKPPTKRYFIRLRNLVMLMLMYEHDLNVKDVTKLKWHDLNLFSGMMVKKDNPESQTNILLSEDSQKLLEKWRDCQAKSTYYKALEHVFTNTEGRSVPPLYVQLLQLGLIIHTFLPLNFLPIEQARNVLEE